MLTVFMATSNREQILRDVLEHYCRLEQPSGAWKLVVIDNGSTDRTAQVVTSFTHRIPVQYLVEQLPGKNAALNTGLDLLEGDLAVFTDDDVFPHANWLVELRRAADSNPSYSIFGGAVVPRWESPPPDWIRWIDLGPVYTLTEPSWKEGPVDVSVVFGPNMAIRSSIFESGMRFNPSIGPRGKSYPMGSETEMVLRIASQGHQAWHVPGAIVEHFIRKEQLQKRWVWGRAVRYGRGQYRLSAGGKENAVEFAGAPVYLYIDMFRKIVRLVVALLFFRGEYLFRSFWYLNFRRGELIEARNMTRERRERSKSVPHAVA